MYSKINRDVSGNRNKEEQLLAGRLSDLANICYNRNIPVFSGFLNLNEQNILEQNAHGSSKGVFSNVCVLTDGGYEYAERKIAVLRYDLEHPSEVGVTEQIEAMNYGSGEGVGHSKGHISNKTLYIALNYEEQAKQLNAESAKEIADELFILERRQKKLLYYISLLEKRQAEVVRMVYMEGVSTKKAAEQHGLTVRTIERIRKDAVDNLAEMYAYSERYNG